jgi:hypothetical protein
MTQHRKRYAPVTDERGPDGCRVAPPLNAPTMSASEARALSTIFRGGRPLVWRLDPTGWRCII